MVMELVTRAEKWNGMMIYSQIPPSCSNAFFNQNFQLYRLHVLIIILNEKWSQGYALSQMGISGVHLHGTNSNAN